MNGKNAHLGKFALKLISHKINSCIQVVFCVFYTNNTMTNGVDGDFDNLVTKMMCFIAVASMLATDGKLNINLFDSTFEIVGSLRIREKKDEWTLINQTLGQSDSKYLLNFRLGVLLDRFSDRKIAALDQNLYC